MPFLMIALGIAVTCVTVALTASLICFFMIFYSFREKNPEEYPIPEGKIYEERKDQLVAWIKEANERRPLEFSVKSYDGLILRGKYFEIEKGAPIEIMFHGYKGSAKRDLSGGVYRCSRLAHNVLTVDHRASGQSEGHVITFGAKETKDCLAWIDFVIKNIDPNAKIILTGISMGAATVMSASNCKLPENVVGILADCGYTSTEDVIKKVVADMKLPPRLIYPFARLGAILFGGFDPNKSSPRESLKSCKLPIIFFHGDTDDYVPCYMSEENYNICASPKKRFVVIKGAGHGLCFPVDQELYLKEMKDFFNFINN